MRFLPDPAQDLELPSSLAAHKFQKYRWSKGYGQVTRNSLGRFLASKELSLTVKIEALFHLTGALQYTCGVASMLLAPALCVLGLMRSKVFFLSVFPALSWVIVCVYTVLRKQETNQSTLKARLARLRYVPATMLIAVGISVHQTVATLEGYLSRDATFIRTPKEGSDGATARLDMLDQVHNISKANQEEEDDDANVATCCAGALSCAVATQEQFTRFTTRAELAMLAYSFLGFTFIFLKASSDGQHGISRIVFMLLSMVQTLGLACIALGPHVYK